MDSVNQNKLPGAEVLSLALGVPVDLAQWLIDLEEIRLNVTKQRTWPNIHAAITAEKA